LIWKQEIDRIDLLCNKSLPGKYSETVKELIIMSKLSIQNLHVSIDNKEILKGVDLAVNQGEIHALMGPNGTGKSTLAYALMGHPTYEVTEGEVWFKGKNVLELEPALGTNYLAFNNSIRLSLQLLGIDRKKEEKIFDVVAYGKEKCGGKDEEKRRRADDAHVRPEFLGKIYQRSHAPCKKANVLIGPQRREYRCSRDLA